MKALKEACLLNDEAVRLLESGDCVGAIRILQRGVSTLREFSCLSDNPTGTHGTTATTMPLPSLSTPSPTATPSTLPACGGQVGKLQGLQKDQNFVFARPLQLHAISDNAGEFEIMTYSSILLFNLGLACHMLNTQDRRAVPLSRAAKCYNLAFSVLSRMPLVPRSRDHDHDGSGAIPDVLKCLLLNNLAQLHYEECDYQGSQYYLQRMHIMVRAGCLDSPPATQYVLSKDDTDELKLNLLSLKKPSAARAA